MADQLILLHRGDPHRAQAICDAFGVRTGLTGEPVTGGVRFPLSRDDRRVRVAEILTDIDPKWERHVALPESSPAAPSSSRQ